MFAIIRSGGKQYKVKSGDVIRVDRLAGDEGDKVNIDDVMMVSDKDKPKLGAGKVAGEIVRQLREKKVLVFKKKRRHNYRRKKGHRQYMTEIKITDISA